jgi:hypothetical protein
MYNNPQTSMFGESRAASSEGTEQAAAAGPGYHTCGYIKGKEKNSQKGKGKRGEKGNLLRFISTVILPMMKKSRKSPKIYCILHYIYVIFWTAQI